MKKCLFIINPKSGQNTIQPNIDRYIGNLIIRKIINHVDVEFTTVKKNGYALSFIASNDYDFIVAVGGDGTINEVIHGMIDSKKTMPVALLCAGTVNDFASFLQLPTSIDKFCDMIEQFYHVPCDVGKVNQRYFINVAAAGMFSDVAINVSKEEKKLLGALAYYLNGLISFPSQVQKQLNLKITLNHEEIFEDTFSLLLVTNTNRVGGFMEVAPIASIHDGLLDLILIKKCNVAELANLSKDFLLKKHLSSPYIIYKQAKHIQIESNIQHDLDLDGEKGGTIPCTIKTIPSAIKIIVSKQKK